MKILITGIHGFVGSNLVKALSKKHIVYGLDIVSPIKPGIERTYSWNDIEKNNVPYVDIIIHLAGKAHDTKNKAQSDIYFKINTDLTKKIYDYFLSSNCHKFIFFSSVKAAADKVVGNILTEDIIPNPVGPYGESKIAAEKYILSKEDIRESLKKEVYIFRPCMIHGPGNKGNLNLLYSVIKKGIPWPLGSFENKRSFTSIDNLCYIIDSFINKNIESGIYHVGDDDALSTNELIDLMCKAMGRKATILHIPKILIKFLAKLGTILHLPLNNERLQKLTENYIVSNSKVKNAIGIKDLPVKAVEGLTITIKSFDKNKKCLKI